MAFYVENKMKLNLYKSSFEILSSKKVVSNNVSWDNIGTLDSNI